MYRRLRGAQDGGSKVPPKKVLKIQVATSNLFVDKRSPQEGPKSAQNEAKRAPEESKEHLYIPNLDFIKNATFSTIILRFLRVRGPACELKIAKKGLKHEENNDVEQESKRRDEKKL